MPLSTQFFPNDSCSNPTPDLFKTLGGLQIKAYILILGSYHPPHIKDFILVLIRFPPGHLKAIISLLHHFCADDTHLQPHSPPLMCWHIYTLSNKSESEALSDAGVWAVGLPKTQLAGRCLHSPQQSQNTSSVVFFYFPTLAHHFSATEIKKAQINQYPKKHTLP